MAPSVNAFLVVFSKPGGCLLYCANIGIAVPVQRADIDPLRPSITLVSIAIGSVPADASLRHPDLP